jgi:hypothetical protein
VVSASLLDSGTLPYLIPLTVLAEGRQSDGEPARTLLAKVIADYEQQAPTAVAILERGFDDATAVLALPLPYRKRLRTTRMAKSVSARLSLKIAK